MVCYHRHSKYTHLAIVEQFQAGKLTNPSYSYDLHGNIAAVTSSNGAGRTHTWTSFDNPDALSLRDAAGNTASISFLYGPEHQRIREVTSKTNAGATSQKTLAVLHPDNEGSLFFERETINTGAGAGTSQNRHYLSAEKGSFLLVTSNGAIQTDAQSSSSLSNPTAVANADYKYWHKDHLGSIVASTNSNLTVIERLAYEPFGKRRFANGSYDQTGTIDATSTTRGFTGHEHLDELDFIHMNARVYDPDIGRFLSPDPKITYYSNTQGFNRYAYVQNNPLNSYDPDGFDRRDNDGVNNGYNGAAAVSSDGKSPDTTDTGAQATRTGSSDPTTKRDNGLGFTGTMRDFFTGVRLGERSVLDPSRPVDSSLYSLGIATRQAGKEMLGIQSYEDAKLSFSKGNYVTGTLQGMQAPGNLALTIGAPLANLGRRQGVTEGIQIGSRLGAPVGRYEVGLFDALKARSVPRDDLDIHHAMQKHPAGQIVDGYNPSKGPSIAVPSLEHSRIPTQKGAFGGTPRDLLAKDINDLRNYTNAPNSALRELVDLNKQMYPGAFKK
ncbi:MAG: RHS repeat-associated core domain-containing protein [Brachymonas sp.]|nr:RHS repeat-associated core domain-containing protein [Brachymonas sp.]